MSAARKVRRWMGSTSNRTFIVYPLMVVAVELLLRHGRPDVHIAAAPLLAWGYLQYRLAGDYRLAHGRGGPGMSVPPERLVTTGIYRYTRNPMYLGHMIFMLGLALTFRSVFAGLLLLAHVPWFHRRALDDEAQLAQVFGTEYDVYRARVRRWIPWLI